MTEAREYDAIVIGSGQGGKPLAVALAKAGWKTAIIERAYIGGVLETHGGKLTAAAKHADMDPKNFSEKLARYGLRRTAATEDAERG